MPMSVWCDRKFDWQIGARATHLTTFNCCWTGISDKALNTRKEKPPFRSSSWVDCTLNSAIHSLI